MMQVVRDMICNDCGSKNEHEQITRTKEMTVGNIIQMIIRCKKCGHEHIEGTLTTWSDTGDPVVFKIDDWTITTEEF